MCKTKPFNRKNKWQIIAIISINEKSLNNQKIILKSLFKIIKNKRSNKLQIIQGNNL